MPSKPTTFSDALRKALAAGSPVPQPPLGAQIAQAVGLPTHQLASISVNCRSTTEADEIVATYFVASEGRRRMAAVLSRYKAVQRMPATTATGVDHVQHTQVQP